MNVTSWIKSTVHVLSDTVYIEIDRPQMLPWLYVELDVGIYHLGRQFVPSRYDHFTGICFYFPFSGFIEQQCQICQWNCSRYRINKILIDMTHHINEICFPIRVQTTIKIPPPCKTIIPTRKIDVSLTLRAYIRSVCICTGLKWYIAWLSASTWWKKLWTGFFLWKPKKSLAIMHMCLFMY